MWQVNPLRAKKLYVLAAMEVERYRKRTLSLDVGGTRANGTTTAEATAATLETLLKQDAEATRGDGMGIASRTLDNAWHGAEAFHFFLLAQRQMYNGNVDQACVRAHALVVSARRLHLTLPFVPRMRTSLRLVHYEDILDPRDIYSLIALTSFYNKVRVRFCVARYVPSRLLTTCRDARTSTTGNARARSFGWRAWRGCRRRSARRTQTWRCKSSCSIRRSTRPPGLTDVRTEAAAAT